MAGCISIRRLAAVLACGMGAWGCMLTPTDDAADGDATSTTRPSSSDASSSDADESDGSSDGGTTTGTADGTSGTNTSSTSTSTSGGTTGNDTTGTTTGSTGLDDPTTTAEESSSSDVGSEDTGEGGCPHAGSVRYRLNGTESWPSEVVERLTAAMDEAVYYYNCYSDLSHDLTINYDPGVPTAQANVDGWISFGSDRNYMVVATAMHEVGHAMGVGFSPWNELLMDGRWTGAAVNELMKSIPPEERDPDEGARDYITADRQHFWPYGLNYASEHRSEWSLINHVRVVAAMRVDKDAFLAR